jgi:hypothetical protein
LFGVVYMAPARDVHAVHHDAAAERPMNWSLVPLMLGSIGLGWLGLVGWLGFALGDTVSPSEVRPELFTLIGGVAFTLGIIGFLGAVFWYVFRPRTVIAAGETSYRPDAWVRAIADGGYAIADGLSRVQSGLLVRYVFGSLVGVAIILLVRMFVR